MEFIDDQATASGSLDELSASNGSAFSRDNFIDDGIVMDDEEVRPNPYMQPSRSREYFQTKFPLIYAGLCNLVEEERKKSEISEVESVNEEEDIAKEDHVASETSSLPDIDHLGGKGDKSTVIDISSDDCRLVVDKNVMERKMLLKALFSDSDSVDSVKRRREEEDSVKRRKKEEEGEDRNSDRNSDGGSDIGTVKSDRVVLMQKEEEEEEEEQQPLVINLDENREHMAVDDEISFKSRQDEVVLRCIIWNGKRSMYHCRKCVLCDQFVSVYFWIRHIRLEKHVKKVKMHSYMVPPLHNSRTYIKEMKLYQNLFLFEDEEKPPETIDLCEGDNDSIKSALSAASVTGSVISKADMNKVCYCSYCDKGPMTYFEKATHEENWHESDIEREVEQSLHEINEKRKKLDPLYCELCDVKVFTEDYMLKHKSGKKHKFNVEKKGKGESVSGDKSVGGHESMQVVSDKGFKFCQCCQKKLSVSNWSHHIKTRKHRNNILKADKLQDKEKDKDIQKERGTVGDYECRPCERFFKNKSVLLKHLSSKKHIQIVANSVGEGKSDKKAVGSLFLCTFTNLSSTNFYV